MLYNRRPYYICFITEGVIIYALDFSVLLDLRVVQMLLTERKQTKEKFITFKIWLSVTSHKIYPVFKQND